MKEDTCVRSVSAFLRLLKIFGLFANSVHGGEMTRDRVFGPGLCYFWLFAVAARVSYLFYENANKSGDAITLNGVCLFVEAVLCSAIILTSLKQQQHVQFFAKLDEYDGKTRFFDTKKRQRYQFFWTSIVLIACWFLVRLAIDLLQFRSGSSKLAWHECLKVVPATVLLFILSCNAFKINLQLFLLQRRFARFNETLSSNNSWPGRSGELRARIDAGDVKGLHVILCEACEIFNDTHSLSLFCVSSQTVMTALFPLYMEDMEHVYDFNAWIMLLQLLSICAWCHLVENEADETGRIVMGRRITLFDRRNFEERIDAGIHLLHRRVKFSACGCFDTNLQFYGNVITLIVASYWLADYNFFKVRELEGN